MKSTVTLVCCLFIFLLSHALGNQPSKQQWQDDLTYLVEHLESIHPDLYRHIPKEKFESEIEKLRSDIPALTDDEIAVRMMHLTASINDGHTQLTPVGFSSWFPIRFYNFNDGIFITAIGKGYERYVGWKVVTIGKMPAEEAAAQTGTVFGADNEFGKLEGNVYYLSNAHILLALRIIDSCEEMPLQLQSPDGREETITLKAVEQEKFTVNWQQWGEMYGPTDVNLISAFGGRLSKDFRNGDTTLPVHLRARIPFWFVYMESTKALYFQWNFVSNDWKGESFDRFLRRLFGFVDHHTVERFIMDIRYNSGGNGNLVDRTMHEFIKRDSINRDGHLYTIIGRKTFSAAAMIMGEMKRHTNTIFVGEPAGAPLNSCGDPTTFELPNSKFELEISTVYHQVGRAGDTSKFFPVQIPVVYTAKEYFNGIDPALAAIMNSGCRSIVGIIKGAGARQALEEYAKQKSEYGKYYWWNPFSEEGVNDLGYTHLREKDVESAITIFTLNTEAFPGSWNVWDSLGEAYLAAGNEKDAADCYRKSFALNPNNRGARVILEKLKGK